MALSGTLETFSLPDVLRLLASTNKTGLLTLTGDRGLGRVFVDDGDIVAADSGQNTDIDTVVFDLLRFKEGSFDFEAGARPEGGEDGRRSVDETLGTAESLLDEWKEIEAVVPSLDVCVRLVEEVDQDVTVTTDQWRVLARVGGGASGRRLAAQLELSELDACRQLRDLVDRQLVEIDDEVVVEDPDQEPELHVGRHLQEEDDDAVEPEAPSDADDAEPSFVAPALSEEEVSSLGLNLASFVAGSSADEPRDAAVETPVDEFGGGEDVPAPGVDLQYAGDDIDADEVAPSDPAPLVPVEAVDDVEDVEDVDDGEQVEEVEEVEPVGERTEVEPETVPADDADDSDEFLSQLSNLSPKAAAAIEATASEEDRKRTVEDVDEGSFLSSLDPEAPSVDAAEEDADGEISQNLLLRFLSSTKQ